MKKSKELITKKKLIREIILYFPKLDEDYMFADLNKLTNYGLQKMLELFEGKTKDK